MGKTAACLFGAIAGDAAPAGATLAGVRPPDAAPRRDADKPRRKDEDKAPAGTDEAPLTNEDVIDDRRLRPSPPTE